jgi:hypothetical protein
MAMAYIQSSGGGEYQVPQPSGHNDRVTPDERAPTHLWLFLFLGRFHLQSKSPVIPGRATSAFTRVSDALWREPGIQSRAENFALDSGLARCARAPE